MLRFPESDATVVFVRLRLPEREDTIPESARRLALVRLREPERVAMSRVLFATVPESESMVFERPFTTHERD